MQQEQGEGEAEDLKVCPKKNALREVLYKQKEFTTDQIRSQLGISKGTLYKYLRGRNVQIGV
jgi:predicted transcriptional regulator